MDELVCAKCRGTLEERDIVGVLVEQCDQCRSLFFDMGDLARVLADGDAPAATAEESTEEILSCPRCQIPLERVTAGDGGLFSYDLCSACRGLWLDSRELATLENALVPQSPDGGKDAESRRQRAALVIEELERLLAKIDAQRDARLARLDVLLDKLQEKGLGDEKESRSIRSAIDAETTIAREALGQSRLFEEARRLCIAGLITGAQFEAIRQRVVLAER